MKIIKYLVLIVSLVACSDNVTDPTLPSNSSRIYNTENISSLESSWNKATRTAEYSITFKNQTHFAGEIVAIENNKSPKRIFGGGSFSWSAGAQEYTYSPEDYVGEIHFIMRDFTRQYDSIKNIIAVTDTILWAESKLSFGE